MDQEREPGSDLGEASPAEPEAQQPTDSNPAIDTLEHHVADGDAQPTNGALPMNGAAPSEDTEPQHEDPDVEPWPAADLVGAASAGSATADDEPEDAGDDSDAPIQMDDEGTVHTGTLPQNVRGETISLKQGGVQSIHASTVTVSQSGAARVHADSVTVEQSGLAIARTKTLTLGSGATAIAVVAEEAKVEEGANALILFARSFDGDVQPTIDWRSALAFGAGLGIVLSIIRRLR